MGVKRTAAEGSGDNALWFRALSVEDIDGRRPVRSSCTCGGVLGAVAEEPEAVVEARFREPVGVLGDSAWMEGDAEASKYTSSVDSLLFGLGVRGAGGDDGRVSPESALSSSCMSSMCQTRGGLGGLVGSMSTSIAETAVSGIDFLSLRLDNLMFS